MSIDQDIANSAKQLEADVRINHAITHGDENTEVATEGGPVPSIRKRLKDIETEWSQTADPLADDLASTVQLTKGYKNAAEASAAEAAEELPKVVAEGSKQVKALVDQGTLTIDQVKAEGGKQTAAATAQANRAETEADTAQGYASNAANSADSAGNSAQQAADELPKVTAEGARQVKAVQDEGGRQVSLVTNTGTQQTANAEAHADRAEQAKAGAEQAENNAETSAGQAAASATESGEHVLNVAAIADKFGNVDQAIAEATEQAGIATTAADEAKGHAQSATLANESAVNAKEEAKTAASEAKAAEDNATAIVHNDEGTTTPTPGAYPVADSNGHLDIGWTPLLQAMYPYSGVIGSIDKDDLVKFYHLTSDWSNRILLKMGRTFNIAGRFVEVPVNHPGYGNWLTLPEAESTADRAIAFDDIFLDWNGQIQTYRSITPHRTTTGYDRDAIATEHGYSKIQTGLYKTGETYALLLGRVARRNMGAYHPVFNPEGTRRVNISTTGFASGTDWHRTDLPITSESEAFYIVDASTNTTDAGAAQATGSIDSYLGNRPDSKAYDAIYAEDFTPLYYSAKNVVDRQALLFDSFNRAVAGETFSGAESLIGPLKFIPEVFTVSRQWTFNPANANGTIDVGTTSTSNSRDIYPAGDNSYKVWIIGSENIYLLEHNYEVEGTGGGKSDRLYLPYGGGSGTCYFYSRGTSSDVSKLKALFPVGSTFQVVYEDNKQPSARPQFLMVDIIGSLDAMPADWFPDPDNYEATKDRHIPGNWLAVGEEGESLIPDGTQKNYKLSRKCLDCYQVLRTEDNGATWIDNSILNSHFESASNAISHNPSAATCYMVFYRTSANPFELSDNMTSISQPNHGLITNNSINRYAMLMNNLLNKVITGAGDAGTVFPISNIRLYRGDNGSVVIFDKQFHEQPNHQLSTSSFGCKALPYLSLSSVLYMHCYYKELKHNGTQWGDDNKFNIVNKQSTVTDLNGETVIVGQKRCEIPYQFDGVTY